MCKVNFLDRDAGRPFWEKRCILTQNKHVCIYIQEGDNGVSINHNRHWTETRTSAIFRDIVLFTWLCIVYDSSLFLVIFITFPVF